MHKEIFNKDTGKIEEFPVGTGFYSGPRISEKKDLEIYYLRDQISLTFKAGGATIEGRLTAIDSEKPVIEIEKTRCRIDAFVQDLKIKRPKENLPYLEVRKQNA